MKINFDVVFKDLENENVTRPAHEKTGEPDGKGKIEIKNVPLTLKMVCADALLSQPRDPKAEPSGEEKVERYELAKLIYGGGEIELSAEQIVLLKKLVGKNYVALVVGQAFKVLEGK